MSRQNENPAKSAASHLMRGRIVRWLCESCAGSSGDLLTPSPPAENGIAAHPRQRGDRMTWWRSAIADLGSRRWVWDRSRRRGGHNREWIVPCCRQSHRSRHRRHPPHSAHADARPHEPTREAAIAGWRQELASSPSFLYGGASGSGGPPGKRNGQYRHGERTKAAIAEQRKFGALLEMRSADLA